jgi:hypothetical protein
MRLDAKSPAFWHPVDLIIGFVIIISLFLVAPRGSALAEDWQVIDHTSEGYEIATRQEPNRNLPSLRARGVLEGDIVHLLAILLDAKRSTEWAEGASVVKILRRTGPLTALIYTRSELTWPVNDRDVVMQGQLEIIKPREEYNLVMRVMKEGMPPQDGTIRITDAYAHFRLKKRADGKVWIEYIVNADPGGSLPSWLVKWAARKVPRRTLNKLQKQLERTKGEYATVKREILSHVRLPAAPTRPLACPQAPCSGRGPDATAR